MKVWYIREQYDCGECGDDWRDGRLWADTEDGRLLLMGAVQDWAEEQGKRSITDPVIDMQPGDPEGYPRADWEIKVSFTLWYSNRPQRTADFTRTIYLDTMDVLG